MARDVSFGSKTYAGAYKHAVIYSIRETCRMRAVNPYDFLIDYMHGNAYEIPKAAVPVTA